jgi:hypothetical protein
MGDLSLGEIRTAGKGKMTAVYGRPAAPRDTTSHSRHRSRKNSLVVFRIIGSRANPAAGVTFAQQLHSHLDQRLGCGNANETRESL